LLLKDCSLYAGGLLGSNSQILWRGRWTFKLFRDREFLGHRSDYKTFKEGRRSLR